MSAPLSPAGGQEIRISLQMFQGEEPGVFLNDSPPAYHSLVPQRADARVSLKSKQWVLGHRQPIMSSQWFLFSQLNSD